MENYKKHWGALLLALIVGLFCVAPSIAFRYSGFYRGIDMMGSDAEPHYVARIQQVYEGYPSISDTFLPQKDLAYLETGLGENIMARLGELLRLSAPSVTIAAKFVFPFFAALLLYTLSYMLFRSRAIALIAGGVTFFCDNLTSNLSAWKALIHGTSTATSFLPYARPVDPEISGLFLFIGMIFVFRGWYLKRSPDAVDILMAGLTTGFSFYVSPYPSSFLFGLLGLTVLWALFRRLYAPAIRAVLSIVLGLCTLIPYGLNYIALIHSPLYADTAKRMGVTMTHAPLLGIWLFVILFLVLLAWPRRFAEARPFFLVCIITLFVLTNQQVLTGREIQPGHYHWYITKALLGIVLGMYAVVCAEYCVRNRSLRLGLYAGVFLFFLYSGALAQLQSYRASLPEAISAQAYVPVLQYLNSLPPGQTVFADRDLSLYIPIYTDDNAPNNSYAISYLIPEQFLIDRMLIEYKLEGVLPSQISDAVQADRADISSRLFGVYWEEQSGSYAAIPDPLLSQYAAEYPSIYTQPLAQTMKDLGVTLVMWNRKSEPTWQFEPKSFVPVFSSGSSTVYRIAS